MSTHDLASAVRRFCQRTHAADYLGLALLVAAYVVVKLTGEPFKSQFRLDDPRIQHPFATVERVPVVALLIYAAALPAGLLALWAVFLRPDVHKLHVTAFGLASSIVVTVFLTDLFKDAIGRPRPDLLSRCKPRSGTPTDQMVSIEVCTELSHHVLHDGWRSYPSGHSSFAFAGLGWIFLLLASQLRVLRPRANLTTVLLAFVPLIAAALVAISRLEDYRHDVFDVVSGSLLGFTVTFLNWRRYYHPITSENCDEPYRASETEGANGYHYQRTRDEESGDTGRHLMMQEMHAVS